VQSLEELPGEMRFIADNLVNLERMRQQRALAVGKCWRSAIAASSYVVTRRRRQTADATRSARAVSSGPAGTRASTTAARCVSHSSLLSPGTTGRVLEIPCVSALTATRAFPAVVLGPRRPFKRVRAVSSVPSP